LSSGFQWFKGCGCHSGSAVHPSRFTTSSFKALFTHYKRRGTYFLYWPENNSSRLMNTRNVGGACFLADFLSASNRINFLYWLNPIPLAGADAGTAAV
jgi:hypothetical protein